MLEDNITNRFEAHSQAVIDYINTLGDELFIPMPQEYLALISPNIEFAENMAEKLEH